MRILIAIGVRRVREAGAASVVFHHEEELAKLGHKVETWFLDDLLPTPHWPARFEQLEFAFAVSRRIRRNPAQFDVVNLHAPWGCVYGLTRKLSPASSEPPYVFTMQGSEERYVVTMRFEAAKGRAANFSLKNRLWHRLYHQTMYDFSISTADFGAVANREGRILSELKYGHPPGRIWFVPNGVDPAFFQERTFCDTPANRLLYVGTWLDRKGIFYLVESFAALVPRLPDVRLTIAGCLVSEDQVKSHFPSDLRTRISVIPFLTRDAMPQLYGSHDIFVFPSLVEGMPLTLLEAMASAMAVVTTDTCGMADVVEDGLNGLLVPAADSARLAEAIFGLCTSPELRKELGLSAQDAAHRNTWAIVTRQLEHVLRLAVLAKNPGALP
jgi:glycosyltransferase involved in cell wall biosynthesis